MQLMIIWFGLAFLVAAFAVNELPEGRALFVEKLCAVSSG